MFGVLSLATNIFNPVSLFANCSPTELASIRQDLELEQKTLNSFVTGPTTEQIENNLKVQFEQDLDDDSNSLVIKKHLNKVKTFVDIGSNVGNTDHWFYKSGPTANTAQSWKGAKPNFQHFARNSRNSRQRYAVSMREKHKIKDFVNDIGWGDVVHFDWEGNGGVGHVMIVTDFEWNHEYQKYMPLLSGHTDPYLNRRLTDTGYWNHAPNAKIYFNRPSND